MEKIRLGSGKELEITVCGILCYNNTLTLKILPGEETLTGLEETLSDKAETEKVTLLSESGEELGIYNGYTSLQTLTMEADALLGGVDGETGEELRGKVVTAVLNKPDDTEERLTAVEQQITDTQMALCEIYEGMVM